MYQAFRAENRMRSSSNFIAFSAQDNSSCPSPQVSNTTVSDTKIPFVESVVGTHSHNVELTTCADGWAKELESGRIKAQVISSGRFRRIREVMSLVPGGS